MSNGQPVKRPTVMVICDDKAQKIRWVKKSQARGMKLADYVLELIKKGEELENNGNR